MACKIIYYPECCFLTFVLMAFVLKAACEFDSSCYVDRSSGAGIHAGEPGDLVSVDLTAPLGQPELAFESFLVARNECSLAIYLHGPFFLFDVSFIEIGVRCETTTPGFSKAEVLKVKTGAKPPDSRYPDVPADWWRVRTTLLLIEVPKVSAGRAGIYRCEAVHRLVKEGLSINLTISVNGCPAGRWGVNCDRQCVCENGGICHSWDGSCLCPKSWKGTICDEENRHVEAQANQTDVYYGDSVAITCSAYSITAHERNVSWIGNGSTILQESWELQIPAASEDNQGNYTCKVVDNFGEVFRDSVQISCLGCRPGWRGLRCDVVCDCLHNEPCDRELGCLCEPDWTGEHCELAACSTGDHVGVCRDETGGHSAAIGWGVGCGILLLIVVAVVVVSCYFQPCQKITIRMESHLHTEYFRSKDVGDLVKHKQRLVSEDLGILLSHWEMDESVVYLGKQLGEGHFSSVYAGHVDNNNTLYNVAVKMLKDEKDEVSWNNFIGEFRILSHICPHQNIVQLVGFCSKMTFNKEVSCLVLEYMALGSLHKVLHDNRKPEGCDTILAAKNYVGIVLDVLHGMGHLEELRYVHRDLAARNILLTDRLVAKISDFGLTRDAYSTGDYRLESGRGKMLPWKWMAFESLKDSVYTSKSDVWSFGVLLWEIATLGASPYPGVSNEELLSHLQSDKRLECPSNCSRVWYAAMKMCWTEDPEDRPSFKELLPFFKDHFLLPENQAPFLDKRFGGLVKPDDVKLTSFPLLSNLLSKKSCSHANRIKGTFGMTELASNGDGNSKRGKKAENETPGGHVAGIGKVEEDGPVAGSDTTDCGLR